MYQRNRTAWILFIVAIAALVVTIVVAGLTFLARSGTANVPPFYYGWPFPFFFGWFFFIPVIFLVFFGLRWFLWGGWGWGRGWYYYDNDPAVETLKQRFARGEITKEQFEQMRKDLEQSY